MSFVTRLAGWAIVATLLACAFLGRGGASPVATGSTARQLLGPFAGLAVRVQWMRVHEAMLGGREDLVFQRSELAIAIDPGATDGWLLLARHLFHDRASAVLEPDPARRVAWMRTALRVAERGERVARRPGEVALWLGLARERMAAEPYLPRPGGRRALLEAAADDFERAADAGVDDAGELARGARRLADALADESKD